MAESGVQQLVIDPPWPKRKGGARRVRPGQGRTLAYETMAVPDIFTLLDRDVFPMASPIHNVFLWSIEQFCHAGDAEMFARQYRLHARLIWDKGNGVAPAFTIRYAHEYLSWFYRPRLLPIVPEQRGKFTSVIRERAREHSRKPNAAYAMIHALYPSSRCLDVFSREKREGWEQFGNQPNYFGEAAVGETGK